MWQQSSEANELRNLVGRRQFLGKLSMGIGAAALGNLLGESIEQQVAHHLPKAKRVIFLCMAGGPSHLETFDYKPELAKLHGEGMPESFTKGQPIAQLQGKALKCYGPQASFTQHGKSGLQVSNFLPHIGGIADDICVIKSMMTEQINHDPAHTFLNTGTILSGRPSMGSWINYGLGSPSDNLPGFVVLTSKGGGQGQPIASRQWSSGCLPSVYQGVEFNSKGNPVNYVGSPKGVDSKRQREVVDAIQELDKLRNIQQHDQEIDARVSQYEMAFKMQASVPDLMDISGESKKVLEEYGASPGDGSFASNCLLARRLAERGVRFIQLYHRGWDHHGNIKKLMGISSGLTDKPTAALINDLKRRGMLEDTLVIWGGEFGRTPMAQGSGRDHHIQGYSMFMAGGGVKGGITHGKTDDLGYHAVENIVPVRDMHATMLHQLGLDHTRLSTKFQGLDTKLTGVSKAKVIHKILS